MSNGDVVNAAKPRAHAPEVYNEQVKATTLCAKRQFRRVREVVPRLGHRRACIFTESLRNSHSRVTASYEKPVMPTACENSIAGPTRAGVPSTNALAPPSKCERPVSCRGGPMFALVIVASARFELTKS